MVRATPTRTTLWPPLLEATKLFVPRQLEQLCGLQQWIQEGFSQRECPGRGCGFDWLPCLCCCCCWIFLPVLPTQPRCSLCWIPARISLHREELLGWKLE